MTEFDDKVEKGAELTVKFVQLQKPVQELQANGNLYSVANSVPRVVDRLLLLAS